MNDLTNFKMSDMIECSSSLRHLGKNSKSMEEASQNIVGYFYKNLKDMQGGKNACALVRFYKTHPYERLSPELIEFAKNILGPLPSSPEMKCLTLLATAGENPAWNSRKDSIGHKTIPLASEQMVVQFPMISSLIFRLGLEISEVVKPNPSMLVELQQKTFNVFHIPDALGSPYVPAQKDFVISYGVKSVLGFGGILPSGDLFVVIMFSKVYIPREVAELFKTLALSAKMAILPFSSGAIFS